MEILLDPKTWASFLTLTALEIVLGIDNLLFITIAFSVFVEALNLRAAKRRRARQGPAQIAPGG